MATEQGFSNQKKKGSAQFKTIHSAGSNSYAEPVIQKFLYAVTDLESPVDAVEEILGINGQVEFWKLTIVEHSAQIGGVVRMYATSSLPNFEFEVISIIDPDNLLVLPISETKPLAGSDTCLVYGWVSAISDSEGNPQVSISPAPIKFGLNGSVVDVNEDTVTPANNIFLPVKDIVTQASLSSIDGKTPALVAGKVPVDTGLVQALTDIQLRATPVPVSGSVSVSNLPVTQPVSGTVSISGPVSVDNFPATQPVSGSVSVSNFPATQAVTGTFFQATQPVSAASLPLPTGASTLAEQQTQSSTLNSIEGNTNLISLGVQTETSAFNSATMVVSGIDPSGSTVRALRVNASNQLLTFIGNTSVVIQQSSQAGIITSTQKSVGLTAVRATVSGSAPLSSRKKVMFKPSKNNTGSIYIGSSSVTTANGMEIIGPDRLEFEFDSSDYYLISDTAGQVVEIVEVA